MEEKKLCFFLAGSKLRRFRSALDAAFVGPPFPAEYQDVHVIASVLKSYLRDLPDPLLTFGLYDEFVSAALRTTEDKRKKAILNAVHQLPTGHYLNLRYLTRFLSLLAQKSQHNKMSSQNIAIVMSPNLLWPPEDSAGGGSSGDAIDYVAKVNSSAAVNTIVELLVSNWSFFFDGDIEFYQTMTRDELFPDNGGFAYDRDPIVWSGGGGGASTSMSYNNTAIGGGAGGSSDQMTKSMHAGSTTASIDSTTTPANAHKLTHSRSSSHDTSLILLSGGGSGGIGNESTMKRSQSNSSVSDTSSPPQQSSPKLPVRRKHNKPAAPTPPSESLRHYPQVFVFYLNF